MQLSRASHSSSFTAGFERLWQPGSWHNCSAAQQPDWGGPKLAAVTEQIAKLPPLISAQEIDQLKLQISEAGKGQRFILQAGDCAERFQDCNEQHILGRLRILLQISTIIGYASKKPTVRIGRMAGQYAKPRSEPHEITLEGMTVPAFRGENINGFDPTLQRRSPDPDRLLMAYHHAGATLNFMRTIVSAGFSDLAQMRQWQFVETHGANWPRARFAKLLRDLTDARSFFDAHVGATQRSAAPHNLDFFVSHEALILPYEEAMTRFVPACGRWFNLGAHMLWIGERTRDLNGGHVEYCRGIANPIGIKIGADYDASNIVELVRRLNPHNDTGKITLITRFGSERVAARLPELVAAVRGAGLAVTWSVDPMHGNTERATLGIKTRRFSKIQAELEQTFKVHGELGSVLGGVHLELTHEAVTECLGGSDLIVEDDLMKRYETWCDPRLNETQSLELAFAIGNLVQDVKVPSTN